MRWLILFLFAPPLLFGQTISSLQQKALNNYVDYANQSAEEVTAVVKGLIAYYPTIRQERSWGTPRFGCPVQLNDYYFNKAIQEGNALSTLASPLNNELKKLRTAAEAIDQKCKALDTYHKLEDFKRDNFAKAEELVNELQRLIVDYKKTQLEFQEALEKMYKKFNASAASAYARADGAMRKQLNAEREFVDLWMFNVNENVHTGWIGDKLEQNIVDTDARLSQLSQNKPTLNYPASSMWPAFQDALRAMLDVKRHGLDNYNFEAKKSDKHKNRVYLDLINYYNGALLADYNTFIGFAQGDKYYGLKAIKYVPSFELREIPQNAEIIVKPFKDFPYSAIPIVPQKAAISKPVFESLNYYIEFINETWRQISHLRDVLRNFNSSASYYKTLSSYAGRGGLSYNNKEFALPLSSYQKAVAESKVLSPAYATSFNQQAEVLLNILKEMEQLSASLEVEVKDKRYESDQLKKVYEILERNKILFDAWDEKKEQLYNDLRSVFDSYPPVNASSPWYVSGRALRDLADVDREGLFQAKAFYNGSASVNISTEKIDEALRDVIAKEYENMKGIQKIGRNNGLCPYTPYEDLPQRSRQLSENLQKLKPAKKNDYSYSHPYHTLVYAYNDIAGYYNKFCELSAIPLLKMVKQPELHGVVYPEKTVEQTPEVIQQQTRVAQTQNAITEKSNERGNVSATSGVMVVRDTVYIEKRDTVYLHNDAENLRSMEGYAINHMVLLLDVSGSMNTAEKLPILKESILNMLSMMRKEDKVSIIVFSGKPKVILAASSFKDENRIRSAIHDLKPSGKTDGNAGLKLAYKVADDNYIRGGNNRIVLATDGEFPVSEEVISLIEKFSKDDIFLSVFNFGKSTSSSKKLEQLSEHGKGNYEYISKDNVELKLIREAKAKKK